MHKSKLKPNKNIKKYKSRQINTNQDESRLIKINREILIFDDVQPNQIKNNQEILYDEKNIVLYS